MVKYEPCVKIAGSQRHSQSGRWTKGKKKKTFVFDVIKFRQGPGGLRGFEFQHSILGLSGLIASQ